jgi:hypothetical protein
MPSLIFAGAPAETVASASGQLSVGVRWSPPQPLVGFDAGELTITDATGAPVGGLALTTVPWMPAHGHGAAVAPAISETAPGVYVVTPLDFFMAGRWELRTTINGAAVDGGAADDTFTPFTDVQ